MLFKSPRVEAEWSDPSLNRTLKTIVREVESFALATFDWEIFVTCIYRTPEENYDLTGYREGVHTLWRGVDVRIRGRGPDEALSVATFVNDRWLYDQTRPMMRCALMEGAGPQSSGSHLHFQAHPRTRLTLMPVESTLTAS